MKKKFMLPCIAAVAIASFVGIKTLKANESECEELLLANVEALSVGDFVGDKKIMATDPSKGITVYWIDFDPACQEVLMETDWINRIKIYGKKKKVFSNTIPSCCYIKIKDCPPYWHTCSELRCPPVVPAGKTNQHLESPGDQLFWYRSEEF